jgi:hypothetical protein
MPAILMAESKTESLHTFDITDPHLTIFRVLKCEAITLLILTKNPVRFG